MGTLRTDAGIYQEKVRCPDARGLPRDRLERRLIGSDSPPTGLVLGPPGSGKTTLLSLIARRTETAGAWYRAGAEDDDEAALVRHLAWAVALTVPDRSRPDVTSVPELVGWLEAGALPALLVVDDLHVLAGTAAEPALERFLLVRPRRLRVILGSRRPPLINTPRLLGNGQLCQLDSDDLRFRSWEVEELFRVLHHQPLAPEAAAALTRRTGGWAAGLHLFHLATAEMTRHERDRAVADLTGRSRLIRSYLARNVLDGLDPARRHFLIRTAALGVLTGDLCDALLDTTGSAAVLDELERQQFFTTSTDGLTFRYHQVLQTHLEVLLVDELGRQVARQFYLRSAELLEQDGRGSAAVRAYARAEDWGAVARLAQHGHSAPPGDEDWSGRASLLGQAGSDDPSLAVVSARRLLRQGRAVEAVAAYRHAECLMDDPDFQDRCARERAIAATWLPPAARPSGPVDGDFGADLRLALDLRALTRQLSRPAALPHDLVAGLGLLLAGRCEDAAYRLHAALTAPDTPPWQRLAAQLGAIVADQVAEPDEAGAGRLEEIVLAADLEGLPWMSRLARGLQAVLLMAVRPTPWRVEACDDLLHDAERREDWWAVAVLATLLGAAHTQAGRDDDALRRARLGAQTAIRLDAPVLLAWADLVAALAVDRQHPGGPEVENAIHRAEQVGVEVGRALFSTPTLDDQSELPVPEASGSASVLAAGPGATSEVHCFSAFDVTVTGRPVGWRQLRAKARSLLQLLALHHGQPIHREALIDAIWPDAGLVSGTRSLQVAASSIRQCLVAAGLSDGGLHRYGDAYALHLPGVTSDRERFATGRAEAARRAADGDPTGAQAARLSALAAYTGDLIPELGAVEWVHDERERLRVQAAGLAAEAARAALDEGDAVAAERLARRSVEIDAYHDPAWATLIAALDRQGDRAAAEVARRDHRRSLADLGLLDVTEGRGAEVRLRAPARSAPREPASTR